MKALLFLILILVSGERKCEERFEEARRIYYKFSSTISQKKGRDALQQCAEKFTEIGRLPGCKLGDRALFNAGKIYLELFAVSSNRSYAERALRIFEELAGRFPESNLSDDALLKAGDITRLIFMDVEKSIKYYRECIQKKGDMAPIAMRIISSVEKGENLPETHLQDIMWWISERYGRINIILSGRATYTSEFRDEEGESQSLKIKISHSRTEKKIEKEFPPGGMVKKILVENKNGSLMVEVILEKMGGYQVFHIPFPFTIVVDLFKKDWAKKDPIASVIEQYEESVKNKRKLFTVVLDPGHGGDDTGAKGKKLVEKDITLKIARKLKKILEEEGYNVKMTREEDVFIPLPARTAFANSIPADIFISIHINSSRNRKARGIEVYYFDKNFDKSLTELLAQENQTSGNLPLQSELEFILHDLMLTSRNVESTALANDIKNSLLGILNYRRYRTKDVKGGPFYVLMNARMPAVLVETLFISNPEEERILMDERNIEKIAHGIYGGIKTYLMRLGEI